MNYAYVTFLASDEFWKCILVLNKSLRESKNTFPLFCVVTPEVSIETKQNLQILGIGIIEKPLIPMPSDMVEYNQKSGWSPNVWHKAFSKFHIFGLEQFDKIVYLDADLLINKKIDHLFKCPHMSAVTDGEEIFNPPDWFRPGDNYHKYFNAGVMVLEPKQQLFNDIMDFVNTIPRNQVLFDQKIVGLFFKDWLDNKKLHLSYNYNFFAPFFQEYSKLHDFNVDSIAIFHFVGKKPFNYTRAEQFSWAGMSGAEPALNSWYMSVLGQATATFNLLKKAKR